MNLTTTDSTLSETVPSEPKVYDPEQLNKWADWVNEQYHMCKEARSSTELQWKLNLSMFYGKQYADVVGLQSNGSIDSSVGGAGRLVTPKAPPWRTRLVVNRIRSLVRSEISRLTSQKPNATVVPASSEDEDLFAAQAAEQIWEYLYSNKKIHRDLRRAVFWMAVTGNGFIKDWWDKSAYDKKAQTTGDIVYSPVTPFHIFVPDLREEDIERQAYLIHAVVMSVEAAKRAYPVLADKDLTASVTGVNEILDDANLNLSSATRPKDSVMVYEMWLKPGAHEDFPEGGMLQVVDSHVVAVYPDGIPYAHGEFPFTHFPHIPSGKFYATSVVEDVISLQREYNRTRSQIIEAKNRMAKPQLMAPKGSVDPSKITTEPGIVIEYRPGMAPPQPMPLQPLPAYVLQELDRILADIEDITSQHQVSKGQTPPGVTAATAISYLQERDESVLSPSYSAIEEGLEKIARHSLSHVVQYWDVERSIRIVGEDGSFDTLVLKGSSVANGQDLRMEGGSALPISKAARQAFIMELMQMGFIDPNVGLEMMEIGGVQKIYDMIRTDQRAAQRENLKMKMFDEELILQWEAEQEKATQFATDAMALQNADPTTHGLPADMPPLPPDFPGNAPMEGQAGSPELPGMEGMMPPPAVDGPPEPATLENGNIQDGTNVDPMSGLPLDMPLLLPINTWDNHAVHIEVHNRFRKGQAFDRLSDSHKRLFESHVQLHAQALAASANAAMMSGMPPEAMGGGGASAPGGQPQGGNQFSMPGGM